MQNIGTFLRQVKETIQRFELIRPEETVLVGVSGGPDSIALAVCLHKIAPELGFRPVLIHINHLLRDKESDDDERFVREFAKQIGLRLVCRRVNVRRHSELNRMSIEESARILRYQTFVKVARQIKADVVAVAHHKNDLAETILMQLLRGSGRSGLIGFAPKTSYEGIRIVRPFYDISREQILQFLKATDNKYRIDSTNEDRRYLRNRIRLELIPLLVTRFNPNIIDTLRRTAELLADEEAYFEKITDQLYERLFKSKGVSLACVPIKILKTLHISLLRRALRRWLMAFLQCPHPPSMVDVEAVLYLIKQNVPGKYHLVENRLLIYRDYTHLVASTEIKKPKKGRVPEKKIETCIRQTLLSHLKQLGYNFIPVARGFRFSLPLKKLKSIKREKALNISGVSCRLLTKKPVKKKEKEFIYPLNIEGLTESVEFRTPAKGDLIILRGGTKPLNRYLVDRKIPSPLRSTLLMLCHKNKVLWIPGVTPLNSLPPIQRKGKIIYFVLER